MLLSLFSFAACTDTDAPQTDEPASEGDEPATEGDEPATEGDEPAAEGDEPAAEGDEPAAEIKKSMKVLTLGNSFSENAHRYLIHIMKEQGMEDVVFGNLVASGCDLSQHLSNAKNDTKKYIYYKFTLEDNEYVPAEPENKKGQSTQSRFSVNRALEDEEWDIVILQQVSGKSGVASTYGTTLESLVSHIKNYVSEDCKFGWHMTWAYQSGASHSDFSRYGNDQKQMYGAITAAVQEQIVPNDTFDFIIPTGTAIQNARTTLFRDALTQDGYHLNERGCYIIGYTWYSVLTGDPIDELKFNPDELSLSDAYLEATLESVQNAIKNPFAVTESAL